MYTKRVYGFWMTFNWSKWPFIYGAIYSSIFCVLDYFFEITVSIPWQPVSIIGIAVAFYLGFKNNSSYDRTWEARKIWGSIVNNSRSFGAAVVSFVQGENSDEVKKELIYRHIAWLTALRHQLRLSQDWEHVENRVKGMFVPTVCEDYHNRLEGELTHYIKKEEIENLEPKSNTATQIIANQSKRLQELKDENYFENFRHMELYKLIRTFYDDQGKSERIKNFPFPRQYASAAVWLTLVFSFLIPMALLDIFKTVEDPYLIWVCPFASALLIWVYFLMEKIGDYSENPFEGTYNDVPITTIARGIEIDLREMIDDTNIPKPFKSDNGFLL